MQLIVPLKCALNNCVCNRLSFGLYGSNPKYTHGMIRNAQLAAVWFQGWVVRIYADTKSVPRTVLEKLEAMKNVEIVRMSNDKSGDNGIAGMFWRFLVAGDGTVDRYIIRDSDSRLNLRDRLAVEEWIRSGKSIHTVRDHPAHAR